MYGGDSISTTGEKIKQIRLYLGLTQEMFAKKINELASTGTATKGTVNSWEHDRNNPNKERLKIIAQLGHVNVDVLLSDDEDLSDKKLASLEADKFVQESIESRKQYIQLLDNIDSMIEQFKKDNEDPEMIKSISELVKEGRKAVESSSVLKNMFK